MRRSLLSTIVFATTCAFSANVWAHAEEPASQNVFALPDSGWVMQANVGVVRSSDPTELICEEAFLGGSNWLLGVLGPTEWVTFGETAVMRTDDGCDFETVMELDRRPSDATTDPQSGGAAFVMNGVGDATGLYVSTDRGASFDLVQTFDPANEQTTNVRYIDAQTLLVSGYSRTDNGAGLAWTVDVATGMATPLTVPDGITYPYVLDAAGGYALLLARRGDQIVFWGPLDDLEQNQFIAPTWPTWAELSADGQTAWISGTESGHGVARGKLDAAGVATWENFASDTTAGCVEPDGDEFYVCGLSRIDGYDVLKVTATGDVEGVLDFRHFVGTRSDCPADSAVATVCPLVWQQLAPYFGIDSGASDAGGQPDMGTTPGDMGNSSDAGALPDGPGATDSSGCCATAASPHRGYLFVALLVLLFGFRRRRPRFRRR